MPLLAERRSAAEAAWRDLTEGPRPTVYVGAGSCGLAAGAGDVRRAVLAHLEERRIDARVLSVGCIGPCCLEPLLDVRLPGRPRVSFGKMKAARVPELLDALFRGEVPAEGLIGHFGEAGLDEGPRFFAHPMLAPQVRLVLRNCGIVDPEEIDHSLARGGYLGFERALRRPPEELIETVKRAGLRGRGGAGFPTWRKWLTCRETPGDARYLVCNADEGDPGAFMNRSLIEGDPHALVEGMLIAARAIGASQGFIYIRAEYPLAIERLRPALAAARDLGLLGERILGTDFSFDIRVKQGAGAFVCGEETALIASIEGRRGMPRPRPPYPAVSGLFGRPTVINNVETLASLPAIFRDGPEAYAHHGTAGSKGTKTFSLVGKVRRTGLIEVPLGMTLRRVIEEIGGGAPRGLKAVQTGGPSGGCLGTEALDTPIDYESLAAAGSIMGSGGLIVLDEDTCIVDTAKYFLRFTEAESCGKCVPCRVGTARLAEMLERICRGEGEVADLDRIEQLGRVVADSSLCGLGQTAPNPVLTALRYFRPEFLEHVTEKRCRAGVCRDLVTFTIDPETCNGCGRCLPACPSGAITGRRKGLHVIDQEKCVHCRACRDVCRFDAVLTGAGAGRRRHE